MKIVFFSTDKNNGFKWTTDGVNTYADGCNFPSVKTMETKVVSTLADCVDECIENEICTAYVATNEENKYGLYCLLKKGNLTINDTKPIVPMKRKRDIENDKSSQYTCGLITRLYEFFRYIFAFLMILLF